MTEPGANPYAPPRSAVADEAPAEASVPARLPFALLLIPLRWLLSLALLGWGVWRLLYLKQIWQAAVNDAIINPAYSPWPWLGVELSVVAVAVLLALRSRWVFVPLLLHVVQITRQLYPYPGESFSGLAYLFWSADLLVFGFCALLWLRRGLR